MKVGIVARGYVGGSGAYVMARRLSLPRAMGSSGVVSELRPDLSTDEHRVLQRSVEILRDAAVSLEAPRGAPRASENWNSVPIPRFTASSKAMRATDMSWTARPTDLNSATSSRDVRPGTLPTIASPRSPATLSHAHSSARAGIMGSPASDLQAEVRSQTPRLFWTDSP